MSPIERLRHDHSGLLHDSFLSENALTSYPAVASCLLVFVSKTDRLPTLLSITTNCQVQVYLLRLRLAQSDMKMEFSMYSSI